MHADDQGLKTLNYEHPLNERMRTFLRLEFFFAQLRFGMEGGSAWHTRCAVDALLSLKALLERSDIRSELQKELDRMQSSLENLQAKPGVDEHLLTPVLSECDSVSQRLREAPTGIPAIVRENDFLTAIEQRAGVLGGTCAFDLPTYHLWLESPLAERRALLQDWHDAFQLIDEGTELVLRLLRGSADPVEQLAEGGSFQTTLDKSTPYQLLRVLLDQQSQCYPEISGNRHYLNIRFLTQPQKGERPQQVSRDVTFTLERCVI
ncbi:MAG: cell division protein ZapD [Spiribacter salinus]|jgi:cell division protein ZapD|uniref:Cell division protein ZapD n=1 Tax=Spiribacter salinus TaxID=1335746 RepID=A0A540VVU1_9GAMM|nr:cell division protein ZapD [Spiribacter sp.]MDR9454719.1 cell division protein ZapD [Spiribacter sp.]TQF00797.1 MAG: cell division protein ZapD [Spiribacter salinus]